MRWRALAVVSFVLWSYPGLASGQISVTYQANGASLGAILNSPSGTLCGGARDVTFTVPTQMIVTSVEVLVTLNHPGVGDLQAILLEPTNHTHGLFVRVGAPAFPNGLPTPIAGTFGFSDLATGDLWAAAGSNGNPVLSVVPGNYRTTAYGSGAATSLNATFAGRPAAGTWTIRFQDCYNAIGAGTVVNAAITLRGAPATTVAALPASLGGIPDGLSATPQTPGAPRDITFTIPPGGATVRSVAISFTVTHPWVGDVVARLIAPNGASHVLFGYTGATGSGRGTASTMFGPYSFRDAGTSNWWTLAAQAESNVVPIIPGGTAYIYRTSQLGGPGSTGAQTLMDPAFAGGPSSGVWTLRLTDGTASSVGAVSAASLTVGVSTTPTSIDDQFTTSHATTLNITAPGVLANDRDNLGGAMTAALVSGPANGVVSLSATGALTYTPSIVFAGTDSFTYRAATSSGPGSVATVTIAVAQPTTVQPPTAFRVSSLAGNDLTLRWTPATAGPAATGFVVEGGVAPGQVLGAIAAIGALPTVTFPAPNGAFYLRVHAVADGQRSGPSNEIQVFVNTATPPSAPAALAGVVNGGSFGLSWRNTFGGAAATSLALDVSGSAVATLALPLSETFSYAGVPGGIYTFRVRAANAAGTSFGSNPVTLTFPNGCSGAPAPPVDFLAYAIGNLVHLVWDAPPGAVAATSYVVTVGGSFTGSFPSVVRSIRAPAPPGPYSFSVAAVNACGSSVATATQTVFVP